MSNRDGDGARQQDRVNRWLPILLALAVVVVVLLSTAMLIGDTQTEVGNLHDKADATYGEGNWSYETIYCQLLCAQAPRPINDSVPNASVKVGATEEDAPPFMHWNIAVPVFLGVIFLGVGIRLYQKYRGNLDD